MYTINQTQVFRAWLQKVRDRNAQVRIAARIRNAEAGNFGDSKPVGEGVSEMRIHLGPGYRVYYMTSGNTVIFLLMGGDKSTQQACHQDGAATQGADK